MLREMRINDYSDLISLWQKTPGICLRDDDCEDKIDAFLSNNKGLSFVFEDNNNIIGTILCGNDSKRGFIYHLVVEENYRRQGIGKKLVERSLSELKRIGIGKCHIFLMADNKLGEKFWHDIGWEKRDDILIFSRSL